MWDRGAGSGVYSGGSLTDRIGIGVLTRLVPHELVEEVVARTGKGERRRRSLPARVVVYFVLALALFSHDSYEEVMRKLVHGLDFIGTWKTGWQLPTTSAMAQARKRLGADPLRELFDRVAVPCASPSTAGAWKRGRRLMSLDGTELHVPDTTENVEYFGYAGVKKTAKSAYPKLPLVALAECGTHALVAVEPGTGLDHESTLAKRMLTLPGVLEQDMLVLGDRGLYSYELLTQILETGADACFRISSHIALPALKWLPDGSYISYLAEPEEKVEARWRLKKGQVEITDLPGIYVRAVDYEVGNRGENDELFTLVTNILDHEDMTSVDLAEAYHERWEIELAFDEMKTHQRGPAAILRSKTPEMVHQELYGILITHYGIRQLMAEAADQAELDPDRLSFTRSLNIIRRQVTDQAGFSPSDP